MADDRSDRLYISDSTHHRIVITNLAGKKIARLGTGEPGRHDGGFTESQFNDPQGLALVDSLLSVADRKNNLIRMVDLQRAGVRTVAGTGEQGESRESGGAPMKSALNRPWDLVAVDGTLFIAMAGLHQVWTLNMGSQVLSPYAGTGVEDIIDGPLNHASFAQPSGLTTDGSSLFVVDSQASALRKIPRSSSGRVQTIVGTGLFDFGDRDGTGRSAQLQHPLGLVHHGGLLYVADTYNSKIKVVDPAGNRVRTLPCHWKDGFSRDLFNESGGLSIGGGKLYVADTNGHRIQVVDLKTNQVSTLGIDGLTPPALLQNQRKSASVK